MLGERYACEMCVHIATTHIAATRVKRLHALPLLRRFVEYAITMGLGLLSAHWILQVRW
jgi:hypothetical protein